MKDEEARALLVPAEGSASAELSAGEATMRCRVGEAYASVSRKFDPDDDDDDGPPTPRADGGAPGAEGSAVDSSVESPLGMPRESSPRRTAGCLRAACSRCRHEAHRPRLAGMTRESSATCAHLSAIFKCFNDQRELVRALTNLAEELRFLEPAERQRRLQPGLDGVPIPPEAFFPLGQSSAPLYKLLRFSYGENVVFNTKARCPLMLFLEAQEQPYSVAAALSRATRGIGGADAVPLPERPPAEGAAAQTADESLDLGAKKREAWEAKTARIKARSVLGKLEGWALRSLIVKSNDDVRQEARRHPHPLHPHRAPCA